MNNEICSASLEAIKEKAILLHCSQEQVVYHLQEELSSYLDDFGGVNDMPDDLNQALIKADEAWDLIEEILQTLKAIPCEERS